MVEAMTSPGPERARRENCTTWILGERAAHWELRPWVGNNYDNHSVTAVWQQDRRDKSWTCLSCCCLIFCRSYHWTRSLGSREPTWCGPQRSLPQDRAQKHRHWSQMQASPQQPVQNVLFLSTEATVDVCKSFVCFMWLCIVIM